MRIRPAAWLCAFAVAPAAGGPPVRDHALAPAPFSARVDSLFAHVDELLPESGFPNGSRRFLLTAQSGERNDGDERMRLWLPPSGSLLSGVLEIEDGARLTLGVGCEFFDSVWPAEGSGEPAPPGARIGNDFVIEWVAANDGAAAVPAIPVLATRVVFDPRTAVDGRVRSDLDCELPAAVRGRGRLRFRVTRSDGPPGDISILPTLWGPRVVHRAREGAAPGAPPIVAPPIVARTRDEVVVDLLDPRFVAGHSSPAAGGQPARSGADPVELGSITQIDFDASGHEKGRTTEPLRRPRLAVEAHFEAGEGDDLPRGGRQPALAFAASGRARFELTGDEVANGAHLCFEPGFFQFAGVGGDALAPARATWHVVVDGQELASGEFATPTHHEACGWGDPVIVPLAPAAAPAPETATTRVVELKVELSDYATPPELLLTREPLAKHDPLDPGGTRERHLRLVAPWFGLGRPRIVRAREVAPVAASLATPNVLFICVETLRADEVGFGHADGVGSPSARQPTTPFLTRLAASSLVFTQATSPAPWTLPSVASYLTGLHPSEHGARSELADVIPERCTTLAELAALRAGARTFACVTNELLRRDSGFAAGVDEFAPFAYANAAAVRRLFLDWQSEAPGTRFFAYLHLFDPHVPLNAPGWMREAFVPPQLQERPSALEVKAIKQAMWNHGDARAAAESLEFLRGRYRGEIRFVDQQIELLMAELARRGLLDRTVVVFTGDHGEEFGEHRWLGHGSQLFEESLHVPLLLRGPGIPAGRIDTPVESLLASRIAAAALGVARAGSDELPAVKWPVALAELQDALVDTAVVSTTEKLIDVQSPGWPSDDAGIVARIDPRRGRVLRLGDQKAVLARPPGRGLEPPGPGDAIDFYDLARDPDELAPTRVPWSAGSAGRFARFSELVAAERARDAAVPTSEAPADTVEILRKLGYLQGGAGDR